MIQLYLNNQKADLHTDINIPFTYETVNFSKPEATISSFSKTVQLYGTTNNNKIFNNLYRFDSFNNGDNQFNVGRKNSFIILINDGEYFDSGYFSLDKISKDNDDNIIYNITLYGGIGDFFYNLMYGTNTKSDKYNLGNLYYGIDGKNYTTEQTANLFEYNKDFVFTAWRYRCNTDLFNSTSDKNYLKMFCPIPTYSGYYDDFKSDTILYYTQSPNIIHNFSDNKTVDGKEYTNKNGWSKVTADREMSEWEVTDLRAHKQRLGIRVKNIYDAIKDPFNNGGYIVDDSNVNDIEKQYIENSYLMLDRFDFENIQNLTSKSESVITVDNYKIGPNIVAISELPQNTYMNPQVNIEILPGIDTDGSFTNISTLINNTSGYYYKNYGSARKYEKRKSSASVIVNFLCFFGYTVDDSDNIKNISDVYLYGGSSDNYAEDFPIKYILQTDILSKVSSYFKLPEDTNINITYCKAGFNLQQDSNNKFYGKSNINFQLAVEPDVQKVIIKSCTISYKFVVSDKGYILAHGSNIQINYKINQDFNVYDSLKSDDIYIVYDEKTTDKLVFDEKHSASNSEMKADIFGIIQNNTLRLFDSTGTYGATSHNLNKTAIFNDTMSPYEFLISLGRMFNWKFIKDKFENKIYIYSNNRYFIDDTIDFQNNIDFTQYDITPTTVQYNQYKFGIESPESYYFNLYKKKYNAEYGQYNYNTGYYLNTEQKQILEDCKLQLAVPYLMQSVYYNDTIDNWSKPEFMNYTVTLWDEDSNSEDFRTIGYHNVNDYSMNFAKTDQFTKLCCFTGNYESASDFKSVFVLFDQQLTDKNKEGINYQISDDIPITSELADGNCFYYAMGMSTTTTMGSSARKLTTRMTKNIPAFTNKFLYNNEVYMSTYSVPVTDYSLQGYSNTIHDIFQTMFSYYYNDMFTLSNKVLSVKCLLKEDPKQAMRKFYSFNNNLWILNKVTDYIPERNNLVKCDFIMIQDKNNYLA